MPKAKAPELIRFGENVRKRREERSRPCLFLQFTNTVLDRSACVKAYAVEIGVTLRVQFIVNEDWYFICVNQTGDYSTPRGTFRDLYVRPEQTTQYACPRMTVKSLIAHSALLKPC
jgi:hypothetical protein